MDRTAEPEVLPEWGSDPGQGRHRRGVPLLGDGDGNGGDLPPRRPRWRDVAVVVAGLAGVLVVFSLIGGDRDEEAAPTTTTAVTERRPVAGSTMSTTTTTRAGEQLVVGPLLPEPTGGTVLAMTRGGDIRFIEVDTGRIEMFERVASSGEIWTLLALGDGVLVGGGSGFTALARDGSVRWEGPSGDAMPIVSADRDRIWMYRYDRGELAAHAVDGSVGPVLDVPRADGPMVALDAGVVVGASGSLVLVEPRGGPNRVLGHGIPVAGAGHTLVSVACDADLSCPLHLIDVNTGDDRTVDLPPGVMFEWGFEQSVVSPDGGRVAIRLTSRPRTGAGMVGVVDLVTGDVQLVPGSDGVHRPPAFSADGAWLFFVVEGVPSIQAVRLATGQSIPLDVELSPSGMGSLVRVAN